MKTILLHHEFKHIVSEVSKAITPCLLKYDGAITGVHYMYGHPLEIVNTLGNYEKGRNTRFDKYPLVAFFLDTPVAIGRQVGIAGAYRVRMAIIRECLNSTQTAQERDETNFIPVLIPIYEELMKQISYRGDLFELPLLDGIPHTVTNRYYWGRSGLFGNQKNIFNDWVDAIEIENLELKVKINYCPKQAIKLTKICQC